MLGAVIFFAALVLFVVMQCRLIRRIEAEQRSRIIMEAIERFPDIAVSISVAIEGWMREAVRVVNSFAELLAQIQDQRKAPAKSPRKAVSK